MLREGSRGAWGDCWYSLVAMTDPGNSSGGTSADNPPTIGRFLTVAEVARQLRVSNMTVYRLIKAGQMPAVRIGRGFRLREEDVRKYLDSRYMDAG